MRSAIRLKQAHLNQLLPRPDPCNDKRDLNSVQVNKAARMEWLVSARVRHPLCKGDEEQSRRTIQRKRCVHQVRVKIDCVYFHVTWALQSGHYSRAVVWLLVQISQAD